MKIVILIALAVMALLVLINGLGMLAMYFVSLVFPGLSVLQMWIFSGLLTIAFIMLYARRQTDLYLVYYLGTSLLHFLFDGWIWKVRRPELRRPLGVA